MGFFTGLVDKIIKCASGKKSEPPLAKKVTIDPSEIIEEARKWVGLDESHPGIDSFRKAVDMKATGEPWCAAFVMYCARAVGLRHGREPSIYPSELSQDLWFKSPKECRIGVPEPGCIVVWSRPGVGKGHTGIVESVLSDNSLITIEGNTGGVEGAPHGVHRKMRPYGKTPSLYILGYLKPFI